MKPRRVLPLLVLLALSAGCITASDQATTPSESATPSVGTTSETATQAVATDSPTLSSEPGDQRARERALAAEEAFITKRLDNAPCVESWGLTNYGGIEQEAMVVNHTTDAVIVNVTHPYWYGTGREEADVGSSARYRITGDTIQRVRGDDVSPC